MPTACSWLAKVTGVSHKPIEFRSRPTKIIGERFYIYASRQWAVGKLYLQGCRSPMQNAEVRMQNQEQRAALVSDNLEVGSPKPWMLELAQMLIVKDLPTGVIVGTASIRQVIKGDSLYEWHLTDVRRSRNFRKPKGHPQPVWFKPF